MLQPVKITISKAQLQKAMAGKPIQISASSVKSGKHTLMLHPETVKKIQKARRLDKGVRISLTQDEIEMSATGLKEIWESVKQGANWLKKNVIDTPFYQKNIRPLAKELVQSGINLLPVGKKYAQEGADWASQKTGAFGVRQRYGGATKRRVVMPELQDNFSPLLAPQHPAMHPPLPLTMMEPVSRRGGSFKVAGRLGGMGKRGGKK